MPSRPPRYTWVASIATSFCFPTVANAVMGSVPMQLAGVALGAAHRGYRSQAGFAPALWVAVSLSAVGSLAAVLTAGRARPTEATAVVRPALAVESSVN